VPGFAAVDRVDLGGAGCLQPARCGRTEARSVRLGAAAAEAVSEVRADRVVVTNPSKRCPWQRDQRAAVPPNVRLGLSSPR
jgi:hypothetical protein